MIYLTGATNDEDEPQLIKAGIGLVCSFAGGNRKRPNSYHLRYDRYPWWGADIGMGFCEADPYLEWLDQFNRTRCLYAVSPDAYPDAVESQRRGLEFAPLIRDMGYPAAIVAQDGAERLSWPWDDLDVLFIGGEKKARNEWKVGPEAEALVHRARNAGKWVHMGRVNSVKRLDRARRMGCNSADGTALKYRRRQLGGIPRDQRGAHELRGWVEFVESHPILFSFEGPSLPVHKDALR